MVNTTFDPLSPSRASTSDTSTFRTLTRERRFRHPPSNAADVPALDELVRPHIESFNALVGDADGGKGLLQLGIEDIGEKVIWDGKGEDGNLGTKISCEWRPLPMQDPRPSSGGDDRI